VSGHPEFRRDLYRGTAPFYDRFRLPYPAVLLEDLCRRASVSGTGRLLDLACGPGTVTFALSDQFAEVWAVDQEPEAIDFAALEEHLTQHPHASVLEEAGLVVVGRYEFSEVHD
jgi:SAM-dependent methyltransferases related to tRNA (uracil-5-)-methyltransferase